MTDIHTALFDGPSLTLEVLQDTILIARFAQKLDEYRRSGQTVYYHAWELMSEDQVILLDSPEPSLGWPPYRPLFEKREPCIVCHPSYVEELLKLPLNLEPLPTLEASE